MPDQTFILTFKDLASYEKHKKEVSSSGGTIKNDLGGVLLGFTAIIPPSLVRLISSGNLADSGITTFEPDSKVKTQTQ